MRSHRRSSGGLPFHRLRPAASLKIGFLDACYSTVSVLQPEIAVSIQVFSPPTDNRPLSGFADILLELILEQVQPVAGDPRHGHGRRRPE